MSYRMSQLAWLMLMSKDANALCNSSSIFLSVCDSMKVHGPIVRTADWTGETEDLEHFPRPSPPSLLLSCETKWRMTFVPLAKVANGNK